ncbi:hypothetical protein Tco_0269019 [Tanacetum coccineum]
MIDEDGKSIQNQKISLKLNRILKSLLKYGFHTGEDKSAGQDSARLALQKEEREKFTIEQRAKFLHRTNAFRKGNFLAFNKV